MTGAYRSKEIQGELRSSCLHVCFLQQRTTLFFYCTAFTGFFLVKDLVKSLKEIQINHLNYPILVKTT